MQIPDIEDGTIWTAIIGFFGSAFSLGAVPGMTWPQKIRLLVGGAVMAALFTTPIMEWMEMPGSWWGPIAFLVGTLGWATLESTLQAIRTADLWALLSDLIRRRFGRD